MDDLFSSWPMALLGPRVDLQHENTSLQWDVPSPYRGNNATMVEHPQPWGDGDVMFALQELVDGGFLGKRWPPLVWRPRVAPRWSPRCRWSQKHRPGPASSTAPSFWSTTSRWTDTRWTCFHQGRDGSWGSPQSTVVFDGVQAWLSLSSPWSASFGLYAMVMRRRMLAPQTEEGGRGCRPKLRKWLPKWNAAKSVPTLAAPAPQQAPHPAWPPAAPSHPSRPRLRPRSRSKSARTAPTHGVAGRLDTGAVEFVRMAVHRCTKEAVRDTTWTTKALTASSP